MVTVPDSTYDSVYPYHRGPRVRREIERKKLESRAPPTTREDTRNTGVRTGGIKRFRHRGRSSEAFLEAQVTMLSVHLRLPLRYTLPTPARIRTVGGSRVCNAYARTCCIYVCIAVAYMHIRSSSPDHGGSCATIAMGTRRLRSDPRWTILRDRLRDLGDPKFGGR